MLTSFLHSLCANAPFRRIEIDFAPAGRAQLTGACEHKSKKLQSLRGEIVPVITINSAQELCHLDGIRNRRQVARCRGCQGAPQICRYLSRQAFAGNYFRAIRVTRIVTRTWFALSRHGQLPDGVETG